MSGFLGYIYGLHAGDGVIKYIGQTMRTPERRFAQHKHSSKSSHYEVYKWIRKYGIDNIEMVLLAEANTKDTLDELEVLFIGMFGMENLHNTELGGRQGMLGRTHTEETKAKISAKVSGANSGMYGKTHTAEARAKISAANLGRARSDETRSKISETLSGRVHDADTKLKMSETHKQSSHRRGVKESDETKRKKSEALKGKPSQAMHVRWHVNRNVVKDDCSLCTQYHDIIETNPTPKVFK